MSNKLVTWKEVTRELTQVITIAGIFKAERRPDRRFKCGYRTVLRRPLQLVEFLVPKDWEKQV